MTKNVQKHVLEFHAGDKESTPISGNSLMDVKKQDPDRFPEIPEVMEGALELERLFAEEWTGTLRANTKLTLYLDRPFPLHHYLGV